MVFGLFISVGVLLDLSICLFLGCKFVGLMFDIDIWVP